MPAGTFLSEHSFDTRRLWSLWEMLQLNAFAFHEVITAIQHTVTYIETVRKFCPEMFEGTIGNDDSTTETMRTRLDKLERLLPAMGAEITLLHVKRLKHDLTHGLDRITNQDMARHFDEINSRFQDELSRVKLFFVEPENVKYYGPQGVLFGTLVEEKLPNISEDVTEAGNCIAFGRATAAVFHLMRIMEIGVQRLGDKLGISLVSELNWQVILDQVNKTIKGLDHKRSETKILAEIAAHLYAVKVAWRNEVMHPKRTYTLEQARLIFDSSRTFMRELAAIL